jgi:hypothetical protein
MMLCWITSDGVGNHALAELPDLRKRTDGFQCQHHSGGGHPAEGSAHRIGPDDCYAGLEDQHREP